MRLYATTTSERASKGQGGNNYIIINLKVEGADGERHSVGTIRLERLPDAYERRAYRIVSDIPNGTGEIYK